MSVERAKITCERCYFEIVKEKLFADVNNIFRRIYPYRNETMLALEGVLKETAYLENGENRRMRANVQQALYLCGRCDLSEPRVFNLINKLEKDSEVAKDELGN